MGLSKEERQALRADRRARQLAKTIDYEALAKAVDYEQLTAAVAPMMVQSLVVKHG